MTLAYSRPSSLLPTACLLPSIRRRRGHDRRGRSLPLASATLRVTAGGGLARIVLEQTFETRTKIRSRHVQDCRCPSTARSPVTHFTIGTRTITGKIDRKESPENASRRRSSRAHRRAARARKADIFTQDIGNIPPRQALVAQITNRSAPRVDARWRWSCASRPSSVPAYISGTVPAADAKASQHRARGKTACAPRLQLEVRIADTTPTARAQLAVASRDDAARRRDRAHGFEARSSIATFVVRWPVAGAHGGYRAPDGAPGRGPAHQPPRLRASSRSWPPRAPTRSTRASRATSQVLADTSGSMGGPPLAQAQARRLVAIGRSTPGSL